MGATFDQDTLEQIIQQQQEQALDPYGTTVPETGGPYTSPGGQPVDPLDQILLDPDYWKSVLDIASGSGVGPGALLGDYLGYTPISPGASTVASGGGGYVQQAGGRLQVPSQARATFSEYDYAVPGAPEWWSALQPDQFNPLSEYQTFANLLIPFLSPEDQLTTATNLFQSDPEQFAFYDPEALDRAAVPNEITSDIRRSFFSGERAQKALGAFDRLLEVSGKNAEELGPGYNYLRGLADTLTDFKLTSGANQLTETQSGQLLSALDPLLAQTDSRELGAFGAISRSFTAPFFSSGSLSGKVRNQFNDIITPPNPAFR